MLCEHKDGDIISAFLASSAYPIEYLYNKM